MAAQWPLQPTNRVQYFVPMLIVVMLSAGTVGGLLNYYTSQSADPDHSSILKSIIAGICASFLVPLFLNMISSNLIDTIRGSANTSSDVSKLFVFAGFCLIAAISSSAFIRTLSDRVLAEAKAAKEEAKGSKAGSYGSRIRVRTNSSQRNRG